MLAGVGGRTIAEAKARISYQEFGRWMAYRAKYGPLHLQEHLEHAAALVACTVSGTIPRPKGAKAPQYRDFLPQREAREKDEAPIDLETAMKTWR